MVRVIVLNSCPLFSKLSVSPLLATSFPVPTQTANTPKQIAKNFVNLKFFDHKC